MVQKLYMYAELRYDPHMREFYYSFNGNYSCNKVKDLEIRWGIIICDISVFSLDDGDHLPFQVEVQWKTKPTKGEIDLAATYLSQPLDLCHDISEVANLIADSAIETKTSLDKYIK